MDQENECSGNYICPICWRLWPVRNSKKNKPYYICEVCGVQVFIRGKEGIKRLAARIADKEILNKVNDSNFSETQKLIELKSKIELLKTEIDNLDDDSIFNLFGDDNSDQLNALKSKLKDLESRYLTILSKI